MTIVVLWHRKNVEELWCAADTRITNARDDTIITDGGPKILPLPITCYQQGGNAKRTTYNKKYSYTFGVAYAGSTFAANSTHSLVIACTQSLGCSKKHNKPVSLKSIAELYRKAAEQSIKDISSRQIGSNSKITSYFFSAFIFGYCPIKKSLMAYGTVPRIENGSFKVLLADVPLDRDMFYPLGSGAKDFVALSKELQKNPENHGVIATLKEMLEKEKRPDVGGHFQIGAANRDGFHLLPILNQAPGEDNGKVSFLGWDVEEIGEIDGYRIGYQTFSHDEK